MLKDIDSRLAQAKLIRNYCGTIECMDDCAVTTELFPAEALEFYTLFQFGEASADSVYYNAARGGGMGDYRDGLLAKVDNVISALRGFPRSKRAALTISNNPAAAHTSDDDAKCLRELVFYIDDGRLCATGFMRAQAASIFPKNIHFIGSLMARIAGGLDLRVGSYTHFVVTLVSGRED